MRKILEHISVILKIKNKTFLVLFKYGVHVSIQYIIIISLIYIFSNNGRRVCFVLIFIITFDNNHHTVQDIYAQNKHFLAVQGLFESFLWTRNCIKPSGFLTIPYLKNYRNFVSH